MVRQSSELKFYGTGWDFISGGNGNCRKDFARHEVTWENPCVVTLDGTGT